MKLRGVETCGSVWACPVCAANIYARRAAELERAIANHSGQAKLLTLTVRHQKTDDLEKLKRGLNRAWGLMNEGNRKGWRKNVDHYVRALEVTWGKNGWHPHLHNILFGVPGADWNEVEREVKHRWARCVAIALGEKWVPTESRGVFLGACDREGAYLAKLGLEVSQIGTKAPKQGRLNPWNICYQAGLKKPWAVVLWMQYTDAMFGARQLTWSKGAKEALRVDEVTDELAAIDEVTTEPWCVIERSTWFRLSRTNWNFLETLLGAVVTDDLFEVEVWCTKTPLVAVC
jgi:hypothetical protein